jgi:hypothetical protein
VGVHPRPESGGKATWHAPWLGADHQPIRVKVPGDGDDHMTEIAGDQDRAWADPARPRDRASIQEQLIAEGVFEPLGYGECVGAS